MQNEIAIINTNSKQVLIKAKNLLNITNKILENSKNKQLISNKFNLKPFVVYNYNELNELGIDLHNNRFIADDNNEVLIFDLSNARLIGKINNANTYQDITNDDKYILMSIYTWDSLGSEYEIFNLKTNEYIMSFKDYSDIDPIITADNKIIFCDYYYKISILDIETKKIIKTFRIPVMSPHTLNISPNCEKLVIGCDNTIEIFNLKTNAYFVIDTYDISSAKITLDSKYIFIGSRLQKTIRMYDLESGELKKVFDGQIILSISPNGKFIASKMFQKGTSAINDYTMKVWNTETGECLQSSNEHNHKIIKIILSKDEKILASMDKDGFVKIWNIESGNCIRTIYEQLSAFKFKDFTFNFDNSELVCGGFQKIYIYDIEKETIIKEFKVDIGFFDILYVTCEQIIIYNENQMLCYDLNTEKILWSKRFADIGSIFNINMSSCKVRYVDENFLILATTLPDEKIKSCFIHVTTILDFETMTPIKRFNSKTPIKRFNPYGIKYENFPIAISPDKTKIILANRVKEGQLEFFDLKNNLFLKACDTTEQTIYSIVIAPNSKSYVIFGSDSIKLFDISDNKCIFEIRNGIYYTALTCIFSSDSQKIFFPFEEKIEIWDIKGNYIKTIGSEVSDALFLSNDELVVYSEYNIRTWNLNNSTIKKTIEEENSFLVGISSNKKFIFTKDTHNVRNIFDIENGKKLYSIYKFSNNDYILIGVDGYFNANEEAIGKYIRINDTKKGIRTLTKEEINHFLNDTIY